MSKEITPKSYLKENLPPLVFLLGLTGTLVASGALVLVGKIPMNNVSDKLFWGIYTAGGGLTMAGIVVGKTMREYRTVKKNFTKNR